MRSNKQKNKLPPEKIYFHEAVWKTKKILIPCLKVGHSFDFVERFAKYRQNYPNSKLVFSIIVPGQILSEKDFTLDVDTFEKAKAYNTKLAYELEQRILKKFAHLNVEPLMKDCEVLKDVSELREFIRALKRVAKNKDMDTMKAALDSLFIYSHPVVLEIENKPTNYTMDLVSGRVSSNFKMKEPDCEGRLQLNLDKNVFGQQKRMLNKAAVKKLWDEHCVKHNYKRLRG